MTSFAVLLALFLTQSPERAAPVKTGKAPAKAKKAPSPPPDAGTPARVEDEPSPMRRPAEPTPEERKLEEKRRARAQWDADMQRMVERSIFGVSRDTDGGAPPQPRDPNPREAPTCRMQGSECTVPPDCCSGRCSRDAFVCE